MKTLVVVDGDQSPSFEYFVKDLANALNGELVSMEDMCGNFHTELKVRFQDSNSRMVEEIMEETLFSITRRLLSSQYITLLAGDFTEKLKDPYWVLRTFGPDVNPHLVLVSEESADKPVSKKFVNSERQTYSSVLRYTGDLYTGGQLFSELCKRLNTNVDTKTDAYIDAENPPSYYLKPLYSTDGGTHFSHMVSSMSAFAPAKEVINGYMHDLSLALRCAEDTHTSQWVGGEGEVGFLVHPNGNATKVFMAQTYHVLTEEQLEQQSFSSEPKALVVTYKLKGYSQRFTTKDWKEAQTFIDDRMYDSDVENIRFWRIDDGRKTEIRTVDLDKYYEKATVVSIPFLPLVAPTLIDSDLPQTPSNSVSEIFPPFEEVSSPIEITAKELQSKVSTREFSCTLRGKLGGKFTAQSDGDYVSLLNDSVDSVDYLVPWWIISTVEIDGQVYNITRPEIQPYRSEAVEEGFSISQEFLKEVATEEPFTCMSREEVVISVRKIKGGNLECLSNSGNWESVGWELIERIQIDGLSHWVMYADDVVPYN